MTNTRNYIQNTNNEVLKAVLIETETLIAKQVAAVVAFEATLKNARPVTQYGIDAIELAVIFDLVRAITAYTNIHTDKLVELEAGVSRKGNLEISAVVSRGGQNHSFYTEAIVADGGINVRHLRYITKTSLPKEAGVSVEAKAVKTRIAKLTKIQKQEAFIEQLKGYMAVHADRAAKAEGMSRNDVIAAINASDAPMLEDNFDTDTEWFLSHHGSKANYMTFLYESNESKIERYFKTATNNGIDAVKYSVRISKELNKLEGMKA